MSDSNIRQQARSSAGLSGSQAVGVICACAGALLWGFSGVCAQYLFENFEISSLFITMVRSLCASACFALLLAAGYREEARAMVSDHRSMGRVVAFGVALFGSQFFFAMSVNATNAGTATVLQMSYMVFVLVFVCISTREAPRLRDLVAFLCAVAGTWAIATQGDLSVLRLPLDGIVLGLVNGLCVAVYVIVPEKLYRRFGSIPVIAIGMMVETVFAALVWAIGGFFGYGQLPQLDAVGVLVLLGGVGVVGTFVAFGLYLYGVSVVGSVKGGLLGALEPVGAMLIGLVWLGTVFSAADWVGLVLMIAMLVLLTVPGGDASEPSPSCEGE